MKNFYETIIASGGFAGESYDINVGPLETDIVDTLLNVGATSALQENTPVSIVSTGVLGGAKVLDLSGIENNGRFFFLSVQNTDLDTNNLTLTPSVSINGNANLVISDASDYILIHTSGGVWRSQAVFLAEEKSNLELELEFKFSQLTNFKTLAYTGNNLTLVNTYVDNTLTDLIFTKSLFYTGSRLDQTILTRLSDGATVTKDLTYLANKLISVETT